MSKEEHYFDTRDGNERPFPNTRIHHDYDDQNDDYNKRRFPVQKPKRSNSQAIKNTQNSSRRMIGNFIIDLF